MSDFELQADNPPGALVSGPTLARKHGVTDQTVANWRKRGMPVAGDGGRGPLYDPATCERWIRSNIGGAIRGGRRNGAGRKRRAPAPDAEFRGRVDAAAARRNAAARAPDLVHVDELLTLTHAELIAIVSLEPDESGLNKASLERLKLIQETRAKHREELEKLGKLVDADELRKVYAQRMTGIRERLEQLPHRLLRAVMSAGEVAREFEPRVLAAMEAEIGAIVADVRGQ